MLFVSLINLLLSSSLSSADCSDKSAYSGSDTYYPFELEALPYSEDFLSPFVSENIVVAHYEHHHMAYIDKLNAFVEENSAYQGQSLSELNQIASSEESLQKFAGGAYNHYLYWYILTNPQCTKDGPEGALSDKILEKWNTVDDFLSDFNTTLKNVFGSGWVWACVNSDYEIVIQSTPYQQNPLMGINGGTCYPFLGADAWEHAYYLDYKWAKQDYYNAFFGAIDWDVVEEFYESYSSALAPVPF